MSEPTNETLALQAENDVADVHEEDVEDDSEEDEEDDAEEEAEEIARRLGDQLWAEISKAQAEAAAAAAASASSESAPPLAAEQDHHSAQDIYPEPTAQSSHGEKTTVSVVASSTKRLEDAMATMKTILSYTSKDPQAYATLQSTLVPGTPVSNLNVLDALTRTVARGRISRDLARKLSHLLVSLARSEVLFSSLRNSNASSIQLEQGKRKREAHDVDGSDPGLSPPISRATKRPTYSSAPPPPPAPAPEMDNPYAELLSQMLKAVQSVTTALTPSDPTKSTTIDSSTISPIQLHLHQVFLFAMTTSARLTPETHALQEIGGLIQVLGVLSGIQIGAAPPPELQYPGLPPQGTWPAGTQASDIGTAVYPCLLPTCPKTFSRLYSLRAHQRTYAHPQSHAHLPGSQAAILASQRPYHCGHCPASFARNHDLKRHAKVHERQAWKCTGCDKVFSRRDAITRHKNASRSKLRGGGGKGRGAGLSEAERCVDAEVIEVDVDRPGGFGWSIDHDEVLKEGRRAKMWAPQGAYGQHVYSLPTESGGEEHAAMAPGSMGIGIVEEGEIPPGLLREAQLAALSLHPVLQERVSKALAHTAGAVQAGVISQQPIFTQNVGATTQEDHSSHSTAEPAHPPSNPSPSAPQASEPPENLQSPTSPNTIDELGADTQAPPGPELDAPTAGAASLASYGLSEEQTRMIQMAIANAASAAQLQAEAEAALEEDEDKDDDDDEDFESEEDAQ
ncbi:uncharacterized protein STEHIDRAFT_137221 [Stereum hirsutum FP-91666 SS1]|uniref:uncharacterized protein n=1 Tax=Stereum hirsutum (strain FP-91666) TaxID=721885 RepID=UPI000440CE38|nr:uncharacterized protein STEHIDRAFT_137221 [Stereum hirsutum FP-91666 SS1]EIM91586.1 hypothetical protein STEHIDRAFT_137221 [Stereum hirsutum FP-91666 SS1]